MVVFKPTNMKTLKKTLFFLLTLVMMALVFLLFAKKNYTFDKKISINTETSEVFNYLKFLKNQTDFNHWYLENGDFKNKFSGEDGTIASTFRWESENRYLRSGTQTIKKMVYPELIQMDIAIDKPYNITATQSFQLIQENGKTSLTFKIDIRFPFPYNIVILSDDFEKNLNKSIEITLRNIRKAVEK